MRKLNHEQSLDDYELSGGGVMGGGGTSFFMNIDAFLIFHNFDYLFMYLFIFSFFIYLFIFYIFINHLFIYYISIVSIP